MSKIMVNDKEIVEGRFSFSCRYDPSSNPPLISVDGALLCGERYLPEVYSLESEQYRLDGVHVYEECFGTEDKEVIYKFSAQEFSLAMGSAANEEGATGD